MTSSRGITLKWPLLIVGAFGLVTLGALGARWMQHAPAPPPPSAAATQPTPPQASSSDIDIRLSPSVQANARLETATVASISTGSQLQVPGVVGANAYNQTVVTSLVAGRITAVSAQLGQQVKKGEVLAEIYSPELAEAETMFVSMQADLESVHQELLRTERLAVIGSASQQELEKARAEHVRHAAGTESARTKLKLLGVTDEALKRLEETGAVQPTVSVTAPRAGEITARSANSGVNVAAGAELFTITDLSNVWVTASVYENDLARVHVGDSAIVSAPGQTSESIGGRVTYLDPQLSSATRTAQIRIEVPNHANRLRLAMFVAVVIGSSSAVPALAVPAAAVQTVANAQFVYLAGQEPNHYIEREVTTGPERDGQIVISHGLSEGDRVVTTGSFLLRSERERLGLRARDFGSQEKPAAPAKPQRFEIAVTAAGFSPAHIDAAATAPVELVFTRKTDQTCAKEIVVPSVKIRKALPLNTPVTVTLAPQKAGTIDFACGMNMFKGSVVVK